MNRAISFAAFSTAVFFALACSGSTGGGGAGNAAACKTYIEAYNNMSCIPSATKLDAATICPDSLDSTPMDMTGYYTCMAENSKCNGDIPDLAGQADCKMPGM